MSRYWTTAEAAAERKVSAKAIRSLRKRLGIGEYWGGRAGYRFSEADMDAITAAMQPAPVVTRRRKRRS